MNRFFITSLLILNTLLSFSQDYDHDHKHPKNEIGISNNIVLNTTEKEYAYGFHVHFVRTIGKSDRIGLGLGYERIFDDHKHNSASLIFMYRPIESLSLNFAPGIVWLESESNSTNPALHIETLYEWQMGYFHIGPLLGVAFNPEDFHASVGLHLAVSF